MRLLQTDKLTRAIGSLGNVTVTGTRLMSTAAPTKVQEKNLYKMSKVQNNPPQFIKNGTKISEITIILKHILILFFIFRSVGYQPEARRGYLYGSWRPGLWGGVCSRQTSWSWLFDQQRWVQEKKKSHIIPPESHIGTINRKSSVIENLKSTLLLQNSNFASTKILILY